MSAALSSPHRTGPDLVGPALLGGRYRLDRIIGAGGMGVVHRAWDTRLCRRVAIKVLAPARSADPEVAARLRAEGRHLAATDHPNLVTLFDVSDEPDGAYLVMELVDGESLADRLRQDGPLPAREVAAIVTGIAAGLSALHGAGIVHRDVSPANILLGRDGRARLADFGLAHDGAHDRHEPTPDNMVQGTLRYLAPELLDGATATPASDVYGLAAVTYAALLGRPPAVATSVTALRAAHREPPIRPTLLRTGLDADVDAVLLAALGPRAGRPTAYQFAVAVASALRASDDPVPDALSPTAPTIAAPGVAYRSSHRPSGAGPVRRAIVALAGGALLLGTGAVSLAAVDVALRSPRTRVDEPARVTPLGVADQTGPAMPPATIEVIAELAPDDASAADPLHGPLASMIPARGVAPARGPTVEPEPTAVAEPLATPREDVQLAIVDQRGSTGAVSAAESAGAASAKTGTRRPSATGRAAAGQASARKAADDGHEDREDHEDRAGRRAGDDSDDPDHDEDGEDR